ncbi:MAG: YdcF family protein [Candidatus Microsaccharimonas sp.]
MKITLFVHGAKVVDNLPSNRFALRLDKAIEYYKNHQNDDITFFVSGRWGRSEDSFLLTEAEVGKRYIQERIPGARVLKEDISVELIGNYAFSKPLLTVTKPDVIIIYTSDINKERATIVSKRIFANDLKYSFEFLDDELSNNDIIADKELRAIELFNSLMADIKDGEDSAFRNRLLYLTPYYFKGVIDDKTFFDTYWRGGFKVFSEALSVRHNS